MRSTSPSQSKTETVVTGTVDKTEYSSDDIAAGDRQVVGSAVARDDKPRAEDKKLHWYRVTRGGFFGHSGLRTRIIVGKDLHDGAYDIQSLLKQGIGLEDLGEGPATGPLQAPAAS